MTKLLSRPNKAQALLVKLVKSFSTTYTCTCMEVCMYVCMYVPRSMYVATEPRVVRSKKYLMQT